MVEDVSIDSNKAASLAIVDDDDDMILNCILNVGLQETDFCLLHSIVTDFCFSLKEKSDWSKRVFPHHRAKTVDRRTFPRSDGTRT